MILRLTLVTLQASVAEDNPIISSNIYLTLVMGVMLGLGDGGFNVSTYAALGKFSCIICALLLYRNC